MNFLKNKYFYLRYLMAGGTAFIINMAAMWLFSDFLGMSHPGFESNMAHLLATECAILWGFNAHYFWTWKNSPGDYLRKLKKFHLFALSSMLLRQSLFFVLNFFGFHWLIATLIPIVIIVIINYLGYEKFVFTTPPP